MPEVKQLLPVLGLKQLTVAPPPVPRQVHGQPAVVPQFPLLKTGKAGDAIPDKQIGPDTLQVPNPQ